MLAKTYSAVERWPEALQAYEKAIKLLPQDASVLSGYAEAIAITNNRVLAGKPMELVQKALEINPDDMKGLELSGIYAYQEKNFAQASYFQKLYKLMPPESSYAQDILAAQRPNGWSAGLTGLDDLSILRLPRKSGIGSQKHHQGQHRHRPGAQVQACCVGRAVPVRASRPGWSAGCGRPRQRRQASA
jgi:tetratricopeptide (TPR) repeat protein